jgi:hypothetical protein
MLAALAAALVVTFVAFQPALDNGFTNWDDDAYVTESALITGLSPGHLGEIFTEPVKSNYHPLTMLSLAADHRLFGLEPFGPWGLRRARGVGFAMDSGVGRLT